ncbi:hypothetical protein [Kitasatospora sp. NPDC004531]
MSKWISKAAKAAVAATIAAAGVVGAGSAPASAATPIWVGHNTAHGVGIYNNYYPTAGKVDGDLAAYSGFLRIDCWVSGGQVGTDGNVWYRTWAVDYGNYTDFYGSAAWTFANYVDGAAAFHNNSVPRC